ncbi:MAG: hypothetical protein BWK78_01205 [Thiotrichaceae bacterium IS1]|nr:MAG: hypothetical protein BWK78_01205 [Thiotrichaceae bacterium IS1]
MLQQNKAKLVLIIPNSRWFGKRPWLQMPYAALILTALLKEEFVFHIIDANGGNFDDKQCQDCLREINPDIIMVTGGSVEYHRQVHQTFLIAKATCPMAITILGGVYPTTVPEEAIKDHNIDWLFMYHAEARINQFLRLLLAKEIEKAKAFPGIAYRDESGSLVENPPTGYIGQVKTMVQPDYSLVDLRPYLYQETKDYQFNSGTAPTAFIVTGYGCPYKCSFCASRFISGRVVAYRPLEDVLAEIEYLKREYQITNLIFLDDALVINRKRTKALLEAFIERQYNLSWKSINVSAWHLDDELLNLMKKSGCTQLTISVESGSQRVLNEVIFKPLKLEIIPPLVKKCRELGIDLGANFVIGNPGETWDEIRQTFRFAEECDFDVAHFHIITPLPRTHLYQICKEKGYLPADFSFTDPKFFGFGVGHITTEEFTPFELAVVRAFEWDRINFSSPERQQRVARLYQTTVEQLTEHRKQTRRKLGVHF